ncbi:MAG: hypothetical protein M3460_19400, partial [Actinomycetota bacterium]|nr:hypothetical protein [Actinomycetota bacterium]
TPVRRQQAPPQAGVDRSTPRHPGQSYRGSDPGSRWHPQILTVDVERVLGRVRSWLAEVQQPSSERLQLETSTSSSAVGKSGSGSGRATVAEWYHGRAGRSGTFPTPEIEITPPPSEPRLLLAVAAVLTVAAAVVAASGAQSFDEVVAAPACCSVEGGSRP